MMYLSTFTTYYPVSYTVQRYTKEKNKYQPQIRTTQTSSKPNKGKNRYPLFQSTKKYKKIPCFAIRYKANDELRLVSTVRLPIYIFTL